MACLQTFRSFVTRPTSTHSTTKMLPSLSKQAPCGQMNRPGMNPSRGPRRSGLFHSGSCESPRCATIALLLVEQRHAAVQVGHDDQALVLVEVARQPEAGDEVDVLSVQREALQPVVAAIGDDEDR